MIECRRISNAVEVWDYVYEITEAYSECVILRKQCSAALTERILKED